MQSSSQLFPVSLASAELRGSLCEDIYRLRPGNSDDPTVEIALTRLSPAGARKISGQPIILLHGSFSNRRFWYSVKGLGLGPYLVKHGFDVWLAEMRGHGLSPKNQHYARNTMADYARFDLPAINQFVSEITQQRPHWLGHSLGGSTLAAALGGGYLASAEVASVALFGSQVSRRYLALKIPPVQWVLGFYLKRTPALAGEKLRRGPEDEPAGVALEALRMQGLFGRFGGKHGDWWQGLKQLSVPALVVGAKHDWQDPVWACEALYKQLGSAQKRFVALGKASGHRYNYGHIDMLVSKMAEQEVWPMILAWLQSGYLESDITPEL